MKYDKHLALFDLKYWISRCDKNLMLELKGFLADFSWWTVFPWIKALLIYFKFSLESDKCVNSALNAPQQPQQRQTAVTFKRRILTYAYIYIQGRVILVLITSHTHMELEVPTGWINSSLFSWSHRTRGWEEVTLDSGGGFILSCWLLPLKHVLSLALGSSWQTGARGMLVGLFRMHTASLTKLHTHTHTRRLHYGSGGRALWLLIIWWLWLVIVMMMKIQEVLLATLSLRVLVRLVMVVLVLSVIMNDGSFPTELTSLWAKLDYSS